jgi:hypothetical protein
MRSHGKERNEAKKRVVEKRIEQANQKSKEIAEKIAKFQKEYEEIDKIIRKKEQKLEVITTICEKREKRVLKKIAENEPGPSGLVYEIQEINEPGPINHLEFDGIFKGKESEIRITPDKRISVFDFIRVVGGQKNPKDTWNEIQKKYKNEIVGFSDYSQFGKTKKTPVINVQGMVKLLFWLPGEMAKQFRAKSAEVMVRYLGGDLTLINEIKQIDNHHLTNPNNISQIFREEVSENQQRTSIFNQDQINISNRLLDYFRDKSNVIYTFSFNHQDFGLLDKIGIVRETRVFHERFQEHQSEFGNEICINSVIQCNNISQVEKDFKETSLFKTNKVKVPRKNGDGHHTEIVKLTPLVTTESITSEIKRIAGDRMLDPPPMYIENTQVNSLEIEKERTRQIEIQEETKQSQELTKRMELEFEMLKFKVANNIR